MNVPDPTDETRNLAQRLAAGELTVEAFLAALSNAQATTVRTADLGDAKLDLDRRRRCGYPEVVYAEGKSDEALERICRRLLDVGGNTGKFAIQCAKHDPDVHVTIADLPQQLKLARENIRVHGMESRVDFVAVDVLNEGLDVPDVDTILMLRPTESATIFLQQLGRGLRRTPTKAVAVRFAAISVNS